MKIFLKVLLIQIAVILSITLVFGLFTFTSGREKELVQLSDNGEQILERLAVSLVNPLSSDHLDRLSTLVQIEMRNKDLLGILVKSGGEIYGSVLGRDDLGQSAVMDISIYDDWLDTVAEAKFILEKDISKDGESIGKVELYITDKNTMENIRIQGMNTILEMSLLAAVLLISLFFILRQMVSRPLVQVQSVLADIAEGEGDLTKQLPVRSRDEVGMLAGAFNTFEEKLREIIRSLKTTVEHTGEVKNSLSGSAGETSRSLEEITASISAIEKKINELNENINESSSAVEQIIRTIKSQDDQVSDQASAVEESTSAVHEMVASLNNVAAITEAKKKSTDKLVATAVAGGNQLSDTIEAVEDINTSIDSISETVVLINSIAAQTNLLSMNAAIEAAHAGDSGRGFAVVADEIRKLAEDSARNSKEISYIIKNIIEKIRQVGSSARKTGEVFEDVNQEVKEVAYALDEIFSATEELKSGGQEILRAMQMLQDLSVKVAEGSGEMKTGASHLNETMSSVKDFSAQVRGAVSGILSSSNTISEAMNKVTGLTSDLADSTEAMKKQIEKFII